MKHVSLSKFDGSDKKKGCEIVECYCAFLTRNCCMRFVVIAFLVDSIAKKFVVIVVFMQKS